MTQQQQKSSTNLLIWIIVLLSVLIVILLSFFMYQQGKDSGKHEANAMVVQKVDTVVKVIQEQPAPAKKQTANVTSSGVMASDVSLVRTRIQGVGTGTVEFDMPQSGNGVSSKTIRQIQNWLSVHMGGTYRGDVSDGYAMANHYAYHMKGCSSRTLFVIYEDDVTVTYESVAWKDGVRYNVSKTFTK